MVDSSYDGCWDFISYIWLLGLYITVEKKIIKANFTFRPTPPPRPANNFNNGNNNQEWRHF